MQVVDLAIDVPQPYAKNPRQIKAAVEKVAGSIKEFGWRQPIVVDQDNVVIAGHTRLAAAHLLELETVPVHVATGLTPAQVRAYRLADNRLNEYTAWDEELLGPELRELTELGFDMTLTGFSPTELRKYTPADLAEDQAVQGVPARAAVSDLWICGEHRVLCGSATVEADVQRLLGEDKPVLMVTDPPYGVNYDPSWRTGSGPDQANGQQRPMKNDHINDWRKAWELFPGDVAYVWYGAMFAVEVAAGLQASGFKIRAHIVWAKPRLTLSRGHYHWQHENCMILERHEACWYTVRNGRPSHWTDSRGETTLWEIENEQFVSDHPAQKPVECMGRPMMNSSAPGDFVYDAFLGSGTSMIAAERTGRKCLGMELDPKFVDVSLTRWETETGKKAVKLD